MNILMIADHVYPDAAGGTWNYTYEVARRLVGRGHQVKVVAKKTAESQADRDLVEGFEILRFPRAGKWHPVSFISRMWHVGRQINAVLRDFRCDLIVIQSVVSGAGVFLCPAAVRIPRLVTFHGTGVRSETTSTLMKDRSRQLSFAERVYLRALDEVERCVLRRATSIIVDSEYAARILIRESKTNRDKLSVIPIGVDEERFSPCRDNSFVRRELGIPETRRVLLTVRRLIPRMGVLQLIESIDILRPSYPDILLLVGGQGPLFEEARRKIEQLQLQNHVRMLGFVSEEDLPRYYQAADVFVLPTVELEGFGMVTLEALSVGLPVIGTPVGATPEILEPLEPALITSGCSPLSLSTAIAEFLSRKYEIASTRCREYVVQHFSWETIMPKIEMMYQRTCADES